MGGRNRHNRMNNNNGNGNDSGGLTEDALRAALMRQAHAAPQITSHTHGGPVGASIAALNMGDHIALHIIGGVDPLIHLAAQVAAGMSNTDAPAGVVAERSVEIVLALKTKCNEIAQQRAKEAAEAKAREEAAAQASGEATADVDQGDGDPPSKIIVTGE